MTNRELDFTLAQMSEIQFSQPAFTVNGIHVWHAPRTVKATGSSVAVALTMSDGSYSIAIDDRFLSMDDNAQKFVLEHELGHIKNKDTQKTGLKLLIYLIACRFGTPKIEVMADVRASEIIGVAACVSGLKSIAKVTSDIPGVRGQLYRRIVALKLYHALHK